MPFIEKIHSRTGVQEVSLYPILDSKGTIIDLVEKNIWEKSKNKGPDSNGGLRVGNIFDSDTGQYHRPKSNEELAREIDIHRETLILQFEYNKMRIDTTDENLISRMMSQAATSIATKKDDKFDWILRNNKVVKLTARQVYNLCEAYHKYRSDIYICARKLKNMKNIPKDWENERYWTTGK